MPLSGKRLEDIVEEDLRGLVTSGAREGRRIDFKRVLPGTTDAEKREFLYDISSFANAAGGDTFFGVDEAQGVATALSPIAGANPDQEILRLEAIALSGIDPRIPGVRLRAVSVGGGFILIVRVPRSWAAPHMVTHSGVSRFYSRNSAGKYQLDVREIRSLFLLSESAEQKVRSFRSERLARLVADDVAFPLGHGPKLVLHAVPLGASTGAVSVDLTAIAERPDLFPPSSAYGYNYRHNLDGVASYSGAADGSEAYTYFQVFRDGTVESVDAYILSSGAEKKLVFTRAVEDRLIEVARNAARVHELLNVAPPIVVMISLLGVRGFTLATGGGNWGFGGYPIDRDVLLLPEVIVEDLKGDMALLLKPACDALWNAGGWPRSKSYVESDGSWKRK